MKPADRIAAWIDRLDACDAGTEAALAIYEEAYRAGLADELGATLQRSASTLLRKSDALRRRNIRVAT